MKAGSEYASPTAACSDSQVASSVREQLPVALPDPYAAGPGPGSEALQATKRIQRLQQSNSGHSSLRVYKLLAAGGERAHARLGRARTALNSRFRTPDKYAFQGSCSRNDSTWCKMIWVKLECMQLNCVLA